MLAQRGGWRFGYVVVPKCEGGRPKTRLYAMSDETSRPSASPGSIRCRRALKAAVSCEVFHANGLVSRRVLVPRASAGGAMVAKGATGRHFSRLCFECDSRHPFLTKENFQTCYGWGR